MSVTIARYFDIVQATGLTPVWVTDVCPIRLPEGYQVFTLKKRVQFSYGVVVLSPMQNWLLHQTFNLVSKGRVGSSPTGDT